MVDQPQRPSRRRAEEPRGVVRGQRIASEKLVRAKELRRSMTPAECFLWNELRRSQLGVHFRRQQPIAGFIADFYCNSAGLVIEVDGPVHQAQQAGDERDRIIRGHGLRLLRISNEAVLTDLPAVLQKIVDEIARR